MDFFKYEGIQHFFVYTRKKVFRFRYIFRFKVISDIIKALKEIQTNYATDKNNKILKFDKEKTQNFDQKDYDNETFEKALCVLKTYLDQVKRKTPTCFYCMLKGDIVCSFCGEFQYCSKEHQDCEWRLFHFFECNLLQMFKEIKNFGKNDCSSKI